MKKTQIALAGLLALVGGAAQAEDGIKIYGIVDAGVAVEQYGLPANASFAPGLNNFNAQKVSNPNVTGQTAVINGPLSDPRIGFTGTKEFEGGWRGGFNLETGFDVTSGQLNNHAAGLAQNSGTANPTSANANSSLDGQLFNRSAYASLGYENWGDVRIGRNTSLTYDVLTKLDPMLLSQAFSPLGFSGGLGGGMGVSDNMRQDNSVKYLNKVGDFSFGLAYETGSGTGVGPQGSGFGAMVSYANGPVKVAATYQQATDAIKTGIGGTTAATANTISAVAYNTAGYVLAGEYDLTPSLALKAGYESYTMSAASDNITTANFGSSLYGITLSGISSYTGASQTTNVYWLGGDYALTEKLKLFVADYVVQLQSYGTVPTVTNNYFSVLLDYTIDKNLDLYAGASVQSYSDTDTANSPNKGMYSSNYLYALGARYRF